MRRSYTQAMTQVLVMFSQTSYSFSERAVSYPRSKEREEN